MVTQRGVQRRRGGGRGGGGISEAEKGGEGWFDFLAGKAPLVPGLSCCWVGRGAPRQQPRHTDVSIQRERRPVELWQQNQE